MMKRVGSASRIDEPLLNCVCVRYVHVILNVQRTENKRGTRKHRAINKKGQIEHQKKVLLTNAVGVFGRNRKYGRYTYVGVCISEW